jgi:pseudaminic acid synthase
MKTMVDMKTKFNVTVGLSDHTMGNTVPIVSTALGAKVIEKHFIINKAVGGPDAEFSLDPTEFKSMVDAVREVEKAMGEVTYELSEKVEKNRKFARSLFVVENMKKGETITEKNVKSIRPGYGLHPQYYESILGKKVNIDIVKGSPLKLEIIY